MRGCGSVRRRRRSCGGRSSSSCRASAIEDAIEAAKELKPQGLNTILTRLGENITRIEEAQEVFDHYMKVIDLVQGRRASTRRSRSSPRSSATTRIRTSATTTASGCSSAARPSASSSGSTWKARRTSTARSRCSSGCAPKSDKVGIAHAGLPVPDGEGHRGTGRRWGRRFASSRARISSRPAVAYPKKSDVDANYFKLASRLLQDDNTKPGALLHIATHDLGLQARLQQVIAERKVAQSRYEFAMLFGIQTSAPAGTRPRRRPHPLPDQLRRVLVPLVHAPPGRAARERLVRGQEHVQIVVSCPCKF